MRDLAITLGDPAGIGPEIVAVALANARRELLDRVVVYGDRGPLERAARVRDVALPDVPVIGDGVGDRVLPGKPDDACGVAQVGYLEAALAAARRGDITALVTAPISKTWAKRAGF